MKKNIHIAFDIDGTLRNNSEERHRTEVEENTEIVTLLITSARMKNTVVHLWSNRGAEYCREIRKTLKLEKWVQESNCHKKLWLKQQVELMASNELFFKPDIAYDDQQRFDGGHINIIVRQK